MEFRENAKKTGKSIWTNMWAHDWLGQRSELMSTEGILIYFTNGSGLSSILKLSVDVLVNPQEGW